MFNPRSGGRVRDCRLAWERMAKVCGRFPHVRARGFGATSG